MYLISRSKSLTMPLRDTKTEYHPQTGVVLKVHPALSVQFYPAAGAPDWAKEAVAKLAGFNRGLGNNEDPYSRVGALDLDEEAKRQNWTPEEKKFAEEALTNADANGVEYVICSPPKTVKPWDKYDEFVGEDAIEKILYTIDLIGAEPKAVLRYEKENANREDVIEAIQSLVEKDEEDVVQVIAL